MEWKRGKYLPRMIYRSGDAEREPDVLEELQQIFEDMFRCTVSGIFCNFYESGAEWCPPHQDSYGNHVFTLSLGGTRDFVCENIATKEKTKYTLQSGDIFYFNQEFNSKNKHSIPKTKKQVQPRISVVFFTDQPYSESNMYPQEYLPGDIIEIDLEKVLNSGVSILTLEEFLGLFISDDS